MQPELFPDMIRRPKRTDKDIQDEAYRYLAQEIRDWEASNEDVDDETVEILQDALRYEIEDGYERAKRLERIGYMPDAHLVQILEDFDFEITRIHERKVRDWVQGTGAKPKFVVGQPLTHQTQTEQLTAFVADIRYDTGHYLVSVPALGHDSAGSRHGFIREWEVVEAEHEKQQNSMLNTMLKK